MREVLLNQRVGQLFDDWTGLALAMVVGALLLAPLGAATAGDQIAHVGVVAQGLAVAVLSSLIPYSLDLLTLRRISPRTFGVLLSANPAVAALVGAVVLNESLTAGQLLGIGLVTVASIAAVRTQRRGIPRPSDHQLGG